MEGPTPVSALIHAATMVTAGVYLVARASAIFTASPTALAVVASSAGRTALFAATIACVQTDIKRVLAYSTMSQLGYMFMGEAAGGFSGGIFHLTTHAYFKALLFMCGGRGDSRARRRARHAQDGRAARQAATTRSGCSSSAGWRWRRSSRSPASGAKTDPQRRAGRRAQTGGGTGWYVLYARRAAHRRR